MDKKHSEAMWDDLQPMSENGLLDRRAFFKGGAAFAAAMTGYTLTDSTAAQQLVDAPWSTVPGNLVNT